jgi:hypothetical protein
MGGSGFSEGLIEMTLEKVINIGFERATFGWMGLRVSNQQPRIPWK